MQPSVFGKSFGVGSASEFGTRVGPGVPVGDGDGVTGALVTGGLGVGATVGGGVGAGVAGTADGIGGTGDGAAVTGAASVGVAVFTTSATAADDPQALRMTTASARQARP